MQNRRYIIRIITWLAVVLALLVMCLPPLIYGVFSYQYLKGNLASEAEINSRIINGLINGNPRLWKYEEMRLEEILAKRPDSGEQESRRIVDLQGRLIAASDSPLPPPLIKVSRKVMDAGQEVGRIEIVRSLQPLLLNIGIATLIGLFFGVSLFVALRILPIRAMLRAEKANEKLQEQLTRAGEEKLKFEEQLHQSQKIESIGRLAGGVAHDYNNMLSVIIGNVELAQMKAERSDSVEDNLKQIMQAANRSRDITQQLLAFARKQIIDPRILDLNTVLENMLNMLRNLLGENIDLSWQPKANLPPVKIDPSQLDQILANLCINARDAIADIGKMTIETDTVSFDDNYCKDHPGFVPGDYVMIAVSDSGCGMDKETLANIFEPFFTTKGIGEGTGLGLATVYGIVKQSNGFINVYSEPGVGTTFRIYLPRCEEEGLSDQEEVVSEAQQGQGETVLLVEDEESIVHLATVMLEDLGYRVLAAKSSIVALNIAETYQGEIDLLLTDVVMPEMNGKDLSNKIQEIYPEIRTLYMSGYTANVIAHHGVLDEGINFIQKPFARTDLSIRIREVLDTKA